MNKVEEAQEILRDLGLPGQQQNKLCALTLLALVGIKENDSWSKARKKSMTLTKDIMSFVNENYNAGYKANTRESFRKIALTPFLNHNLILLNPDNPNLPTQSAKTHYAITDLVLNTVRAYGSENWIDRLATFKKFQYPENITDFIALRKVKISNFKSIYNETIELGRINVFIGANGSGKTNVLEALAMVSASKSGDLDNEGLFNRGVRVAKPILTFSSFLANPQIEKIDIELTFEDKNGSHVIPSSFTAIKKTDIYSKWIDDKSPLKNPFEISEELFSNIKADDSFQAGLNTEAGDMKMKDFFKVVWDALEVHKNESLKNESYEKIISSFSIFTLNTSVLRGLYSFSKKEPLGVYGEGLDVLISNFNTYEKSILEKCKIFFDWLNKIKIDKEDRLKIEGHKVGKSISTLYFEDKFMQKKNNLFSAENANEGILHVLFYLALFISNKTPKLFAIDNIETALNPKLCRTLIKELASVAKDRNKQALITTHNPSILDGLNILDDEQRLFEVYRDDEGKTKLRRIKFKPGLEDKKMRLSEMWIQGIIGGIPQSF